MWHIVNRMDSDTEPQGTYATEGTLEVEGFSLPEFPEANSVVGGDSSPHPNTNNVQIRYKAM